MSDDERVIYVLDLPEHLTLPEFRTLVARHAHPQELQWHGDHAILLLENAETARRLVDILNHASVRGRTVRAVTLSDVNEYCEDLTYRVAVTNLDPRVEQRGLCRVLTLWGRVVDTKIVETAMTSAAYAIYDSEEAVLKAVRRSFVVFGKISKLPFF